MLEVFRASAEEHASTIERLADALEAVDGAEQAERRAELAFELHNLRGAAAIARLEQLRVDAKRLEQALPHPDAEVSALAFAAREIAQELRSLASGAPPAVAARDEDAHGQPVVLHVDDNATNLKLVELVLARRPGVRLVEAMTGEDGLRLARRLKPALVILDLRLPDVSGTEVILRLRSDPATSQLRIVVASAEARPSEAKRLLAAGADAFLVKPLDLETLLETVDDAVATVSRAVR